jgi:hypothetical protein
MYLCSTTRPREQGKGKKRKKKNEDGDGHDIGKKQENMKEKERKRILESMKERKKINYYLFIYDFQRTRQVLRQARTPLLRPVAETHSVCECRPGGKKDKTKSHGHGPTKTN